MKEEIKTFFLDKGYVVEDKLSWFSYENISIANGIGIDPDIPDSKFYKNKAVIYQKENVWIVTQPKFGGNNISNQFNSSEKACNHVLKVLGPPNYEIKIEKNKRFSLIKNLLHRFLK